MKVLRRLFYVGGIVAGSATIGFQYGKKSVTKGNSSEFNPIENTIDSKHSVFPIGYHAVNQTKKNKWARSERNKLIQAISMVSKEGVMSQTLSELFDEQFGRDIDVKESSSNYPFYTHPFLASMIENDPELGQLIRKQTLLGLHKQASFWDELYTEGQLAERIDGPNPLGSNYGITVLFNREPHDHEIKEGFYLYAAENATVCYAVKNKNGTVDRIILNSLFVSSPYDSGSTELANLHKSINREAPKEQVPTYKILSDAQWDGILTDARARGYPTRPERYNAQDATKNDVLCDEIIKKIQENVSIVELVGTRGNIFQYAGKQPLTITTDDQDSCCSTQRNL